MLVKSIYFRAGSPAGATRAMQSKTGSSQYAHVLLLVMLSLGVVLFPFASIAAEVDIEKDLRTDLVQSKAIVLTIQNKLQTGAGVTSEISRLKAAAEDLRITNLLLEERFKLREERVKSLGAKAIDRHEEMVEGYRKALKDYLTLIDKLPSDGTIRQSSVENLQSLLNKLIPKRKHPIIGSLPYKHLNYPTQEPSHASAITPAYKGGNKVVSPDDTASTPESPINQEIAALAQSLNWQPVAIYEFVKNTIETEWYWGCMKGAEETLHQKSGNDCDQATLLAALLRASGFPTRYVRGTIEFFAGGRNGVPLERIKNLTGIDEPAKIAQFFQNAGIPYKSVIAGGKIANLQIEHVWVESQIPYANYKGWVIDEHGKTWLGLDTSIKTKDYVYSNSVDILSVMSLSAIRDEYLNLSSQPTSTLQKTPLEYLQAHINAELTVQNLPLTYSDYLRTRTIPVDHLGQLPGNMQFTLIKATNEYTSIPDELIHKVKLSAGSSQPSANADNFFDITLPLYKLSNQQIAISYEPETVEDQEIINFYGGLDNTPAYLVRLRPMLTVNGERIIVGTDGLPMGGEFDLTVELTGVGEDDVTGSRLRVETTTNTMIVGNLSVIGITAQRAISHEPSTTSEVKDAERLLYEEAQHYIDRWNQAEDELASLFHLAIARPLPTVITLGGMIDVTYLLDMPHGFTWKGVFVDADVRRIEAVRSAEFGAVSEDERQRLFMQMSSLQGSILENRIFEDDFQVESISTAKLMQISVQQSAISTQIFTIDETNIDAVLPTLDLADNIKEDIRNSVNQNFVVRLPAADSLPLTAITHHDWSGIGYLKENPDTGESGWMLSGMIAGGATVEAQWLNSLYVMEILSQPFTGPINADPLSAVQILKIPSTDKQRPQTVGQPLHQTLAVAVLDALNQPVKNALVTFAVAAGGGELLCLRPVDPLTAQGTQCTGTSGANGVARAKLTLGKWTGANPMYIKLDPDDKYYTQVGLNLITASVTGHSGTLWITGPFEAYGKPDVRVKIEKVYGEGTSAVVNNPAGSLAVKVVDQYDNPISNATVTFSAAPAVSLEPAVTLDTIAYGFRNIQFYRSEECNPDQHVSYPLYGDCETYYTEIGASTEYFGAVVNAVLGNTVNTRYTVKATASGIPAAEFTLRSIGYRATNDDYLPSGIYMGYLTIVNDKGEPVNAARAGEELKAPLMAEFYQYTDNFTTEGPTPCEINHQWTSCWKIKPTGIVTMKKVENKTVTFTATQGGGTSAPTQYLGNGLYSTRYTTGDVPAVNKINAEGKANIAVPEVYYYSSTGEYLATAPSPTTRNITLNSGQSALFNSDTNQPILLPTSDAKQALEYVVYGVDVPLTIEPGLLLVNDDSQITSDMTFKYTILPPEYNAIIADVDIFKLDENNADTWVDYLTGDKTQGQGSAGYVKGSKFDINTHYKAQVVLNRGSDAEIKSRNALNNGSDKVTIPIGQVKLWTDEVNPTEVIGAVTDDITTIKLALTVKYGREDLSQLTWSIADPQVLNASQEIQGTLLNGNNPAPSRPVVFGNDAVFNSDTATARYEVPTTFVRFDTVQETADKDLPERYVQIKLNDSALGLPTIKLKRPPVVLVHGLWGCGNTDGCGNNKNPYAWKDFEPKLNDKQQFDMSAVDYYVPGMVRGISDLFVEIRYSKALDEALGSSKYKGYASSKVDIIAHSMGGLVTRQNCSDNSTDCQNRIRRVITIATPHFGSELADLLLVFGADPNNFPNIKKCRDRVNAFVNGGKVTVFGYSEAVEPHPINGGAIDDLATGNLPNFIGGTTTPGRWNQLPPYAQSVSAHSIVGLFPANMGDGKTDEISNLWKYILRSCGFTLDNVFLYAYDANDRIVGSNSQQGGLSASFSTFIPFEDHLSVRNAQETIDRIKLLLDSQSSDGLFTQ